MLLLVSEVAVPVEAKDAPFPYAFQAGVSLCRLNATM